MRVLVACEESQVVAKAFRLRGHEAYSCDLQPCSGEHPEWHYQTDIRNVLDGSWDLLLAFPPCTFLCSTGNKWMRPEFSRRFPTRQQDRKEAIEFFMMLVNAPVSRIAIENPIGVMSSVYRKPDQIIQPWEYGHEVQKATCLWLKNLPVLKPSNIVGRGEFVTVNGKRYSKCHYETGQLPKEKRSKARSVTFLGIADAMADQWGSDKNLFKQLPFDFFLA